MRSSLQLALGVLTLTLVACSTGRIRTASDAGPHPDMTTMTSCTVGGPAIVCAATVATHCNADGTVASTENCADSGNVCATGLGCVSCLPNRGMCDGNTPLTCRADGSGYDTGAPCDSSAGMLCSPTSGACENACDVAASSNSYMGCEYWPVTTLNSVLPSDFQYAIVVSNPHDADAYVVVTRGASTLANQAVAPHSVSTIQLPYVQELRKNADAEGEPHSRLVRNGAYRLTSTLPVSVYQFNPLEYALDADCSVVDEDQDPFDGKCYSYTNDASLLLPSHVLTGNYTIASYPSTRMDRSVDTEMASGTSPGFFTVTAVDETVTVELSFRGAVAASVDGAVGAYNAHTSGTFTLNRGDVLQIASASPTTCASGSPYDDIPYDAVTTIHTVYCNTSDDFDMTGTQVRASGRVSVVGGHECAFVPYNRWACDHLEETVFPEETWGKVVVVSPSQPLHSEPNFVRILSGKDGNALTFVPAYIHAPVTLGRGESISFEAHEDFQVTGSEALLVEQFLVGQDYAGIGTSEPGAAGDPSLSIAVPTEQFRDNYAFLVPSTYQTNFVSVIVAADATVYLDDAAIPSSSFRVSDFGIATARVEVSAGSHTMRSDVPFGVQVYGFGAYTSYMYPGGLDLAAINLF